jgi:CheY-like chemotaxis protein
MFPRDMSRPLSGHLDDVDLDEVLRVIALSRRSGLLDVDGVDARAELHFVAGRLVRARLHDSGETVGALLVRLGVLLATDLTPQSGSDTLEELIKRAELTRNDPHLLVRVDDVIAEQLNDAVGRVLQFRQGSFSFRVTHDDAAPLRYGGDTAFTLPSGIDAEELARDAKRRRTERKNDPLASHGAPAGGWPTLGRPSNRSTGKEVVVVDDDPAFLANIERSLGESGVPVETFASARITIDKLGALFADGLRALVVDLVMPHSNGRGILGGLEVLRAAKKIGHADRVFLAFDDVHDDAAAFAASLGAAGVLMKPPDREGLPPFLNPVLQRLDRPPLVAAGFDLARELHDEMKAASAEWKGDEWKTEGRSRNLDDGNKSLETLKALLGELNEPSFDEEIPLLILRFASAFFVRGALFSVDRAKGELVGLGGFGGGSNDPGRLVRSIRVPLHADTVFTRAIAERCGVRQPLWDSEWNTQLLSTLGGPRPREAYTAPLMSPKGIEAVLYADNATEPRPFPDIALLEIFLQQAAAAMERAMLSRQLNTLRASQPPQPV